MSITDKDNVVMSHIQRTLGVLSFFVAIYRESQLHSTIETPNGAAGSDALVFYGYKTTGAHT